MNPISSRRRTTVRMAPIAALLLSCLLLSGCSVGSSTNEDAAVDGGGVPEPGIQEPGTGDESTEPQVVSTASISLTSPDPISVADEAVQVVLDVDGHVDRRTDTPTEDSRGGSAQLVLRVPSESLDETLPELKTLGDLVRSSLSQTNVKTQVADLDARIAALETGVNRLLTLMSQASTTADLIDLESALTQRQAELDGLSAQRDSLRDLVEYAAVEMFISTPGEVAGAAPGDFWGGVVVGFQTMLAFFGGLLVVLGVLLPWLFPLGLLALLIVWLVRRKRPAPPGSGGYPQHAVPPRPPLPTESTTDPARVRDGASADQTSA
jgi:outer membrane murein-binding lipoprotein Lpp